MALTFDVRASRLRSAATIGGVVLVATLTSCGGSSTSGRGKQTAPSFIREVTTQFSLGQSGRLWSTLHPADQAVVSRARYAACQSNVGFDLKKLQVLDTYADPVTIGGRAVPATAVSVRATSDDGVTTATMHAVSVNGAWRWILSPADYAAYRQGKCPPSS
jgi:hypothetical protein